MEKMKFPIELLEEIKKELLEQEKLTRKTVERIIKSVCKKHKSDNIPNNIQIFQACNEEEKEKLKSILLMKPMRTASGTTIITVAVNDFNCVWGNCIYCPSGTNAPKSYTGFEPAIQRGIINNYDPFLQVKDRLNQYKLMGHLAPNGNKCEIIILGGTFLGLDNNYKELFVKRIFDALNGIDSENLEKAKKMNENAKNRCVNFTIETRPDFCFEKHVDEMLRYGATRVEIGVQSIYPKILETINRGHTIEDVIEATKIARNAALKINWHIMPGLPGSDFDSDLKMFKEIFKNQNFRPDYLKIYPTVVIKGTRLYGMWKDGEYQPYSTEELVELLAEAKKFVPKYCRIQRLGRDISSKQIEAGCKNSNIRQLVQDRIKKIGIKCNCIRCREVGFKILQGIYPDFNNIKLCRLDYDASSGKEIFLSFEDEKNDTIFGFLRLRMPEESHRPEINSKTALIRELRVMGFTVPIGFLPENFQLQHRGLGKQLVAEAENIASSEFDRRKMIVMSAVGTRRYYYKLGYKLEGPYVSKNLQI